VFKNYETAHTEMNMLDEQLKEKLPALQNFPFIIVADDAGFVTENLRNFLWVTFTRCNPSHDIYGIDAFTTNKHWGCNGPLVIDARIKPHHAPPVEKDAAVEKSIDKLFDKGGSLYDVLK
ncbi:MAG TPA: hypothetical protein VLR49_12180, partial [Ferruginibacter sp.]|nr:hypothetical protein [Ferruginibacter sp.]